MRKTMGYLRQVLGSLTGTPTVSLAHLMAPEGAQEPVEDDRAASLPSDLNLGEFDDLLSSIGSERVDSTHADELRLKDQAIAELTARLQQLQPLGEELAATERTRLILCNKLDAAEERSATLEFEREALLERVLAAESVAQPDPKRTPTTHEVAAFRRKLSRELKSKQRLEERLKRMRTKFEERHRTAAKRWREIIELKRECRELRSQLERRRG